MDRKFSIRLFLVTIAGAVLIIVWNWTKGRPEVHRIVDSKPVVARGDLAGDETSTIELFEKSKDSVVFISTKKRVLDFWSRNVFSVPRGNGSGFVWDERGHIVTNFHVIEGASEAQVKLSDGRSYKANLVGASPGHDLAVLKIDISKKLPGVIPLGVSKDLKVGQKVFAIGNPFGLDWTLTSGLVSALDRSLPSNIGPPIQHLIQTDAAINPGNSGGPLLDSAGRLIGINTAIFSPSGAYAGVGFAVPVDTVNRVVPQLINHGKYVRPALGIEVDESLNHRLSKMLEVEGVVVLRVAPGSGADKAGMKGASISYYDGIDPGDIIVEIEGKETKTVGDLIARLDDFKVGDLIEVTVLRNDKREKYKVELQSGI